MTDIGNLSKFDIQFTEEHSCFMTKEKREFCKKVMTAWAKEFDPQNRPWGKYIYADEVEDWIGAHTLENDELEFAMHPKCEMDIWDLIYEYEEKGVIESYRSSNWDTAIDDNGEVHLWYE